MGVPRVLPVPPQSPERRRPDGILFPAIAVRIWVYRGGATIADVIRRAWSRLIRKQWLFLYPVGLAVINTLAFLAVYAAANGPLAWSRFFEANFNRALYIHDHFLTHFELTTVLGIAVFAGIASCLFTALLRAPLFHAIAGPSYPLAPRRWGEAGNLFLFYLLDYLVLWIAPVAGPEEGNWPVLIMAAVFVIGMLVAFADYVIVYEKTGVVSGLRRSLHLFRQGWANVLLVFVVLYLVMTGLQLLYHHFYDGQTTIFVILPIAQILLDSIVYLFADLVLIFLYEDLRRRGPSA
jgi:hypothetical protein